MMTPDKEIDSRRFREAFYAGFDYVRQAQAAQKLGAGQSVPGYRPVGAGMHFCSFAETGGQECRLQMVVKIARPEFMAAIGAPSAWVRALKAVKGLALVPPFEILEPEAADGQLALVMPYGPDGVDRSAPHWLPMSSSLETFYAGLRKQGLELGDVPQLRSWEGIPFIFDFSDLRPLGGRRW